MGKNNLSLRWIAEKLGVFEILLNNIVPNIRTVKRIWQCIWIDI